MTQDKMRRTITAIAVAGTTLLVVLLAYLVYQWITIAVLNNRIEKAEEDIAYYETLNEQSESDLEYYESDFYKQLAAFKLGLIKGQD